jgi:PTH1 family peptidyl-tRNA hydrolase
LLRLVVGLGNPGAPYANTRHNLGYRVVDELARRAGAPFAAVRHRYAVAEVPADSATWILLKPLTFMNRSGRAVRAWGDRHACRVSGAPATAVAATPEAQTEPERERRESPLVRPIIVCDDLALPLGALRIRDRGSAGGHNGLASIIEAVGGDTFPRVRLGIRDATATTLPSDAWADYVLAPFPTDQGVAVAELVVYAAEALAALLTHGVAAAASRYNRRRPPDADGAGGSAPASPTNPPPPGGPPGDLPDGP